MIEKGDQRFFAPTGALFGETPLWDQNTATSLLSLFVGSRGRAF
jgi:hypothetical protein